MLEYSLVITSVVSIGHISTTALAASTLGSMTATVTGYSIIQGFTSALDTMLPSAWTSSQPQLVGLWSQRMSTYSPFPRESGLLTIRFRWFSGNYIGNHDCA
jgi:MATE family multidrug resistance protein